MSNNGSAHPIQPSSDATEDDTSSCSGILTPDSTPRTCETVSDVCKDLEADTWLDTWDFTIHRCTSCNRPFTTPQRLQQHKARWHSGTQPTTQLLIAPYNPHNLLGTISTNTRFDTIFAPRGDVAMKFPRGGLFDMPRYVHVSSQVLAIASPVFDKMLNTPGSKENLSLRKSALMDGHLALVSLEDNAAALEVILQVLHHLPVKKSLSFKELVEVAEVADKYQIIKPLKRDIDIWMKPYADKLCQPGYENSLAIAWVFGMEEEFRKLSEELAWTASVGRNGKGISFEGNPYGIHQEKLSPVVPEAVVARLLKLRFQRVDPIRITFKAIQDERTLYTDKSPICTWSDVYTTPCDALQLGHLMQTINKFDLNNEESWRRPARELLKSLAALSPMYYPVGQHTPNSGPGGIGRGSQKNNASFPSSAPAPTGLFGSSRLVAQPAHSPFASLPAPVQKTGGGMFGSSPGPLQENSGGLFGSNSALSSTAPNLFAGLKPSPALPIVPPRRDCSWVDELKGKVKECQDMVLRLELKDFPARCE